MKPLTPRMRTRFMRAVGRGARRIVPCATPHAPRGSAQRDRASEALGDRLGGRALAVHVDRVDAKRAAAAAAGDERERLGGSVPLLDANRLHAEERLAA